MAYTAEAIAATIDAESNRIAGVLDKVRQDLAEALANPDVDTDAAVQEALGVIAPMVDKLKSIGADATQPVPDPTPETDPGADTFPPATDDQAPTV